ncbi:peptidoglycan-binding domain-containing protein [Streptomyces avicenniae]|uniref:peptidoglycan-binding domain-containing protein n=1 Tax=Streptomyces avicenniae TaxID=500153 RepID=UPI00069C6B34|nr:peptidoglycan-binding domain-containing protein [Streptomyces avicenniae]
MTDQPDCLICGRLVWPSGDPSCDCLTHTLSRRVDPPRYGPDPADVALFPLDPPRRSHAMTVPQPPPPQAPATPAPASGPDFEQVAHLAPRRAPATHRKPRQRTRMAAAAGGAVAAVVGTTALAASFLGAQGRSDEALRGDTASPTLAIPDEDVSDTPMVPRPRDPTQTPGRGEDSTRDPDGHGEGDGDVRWDGRTVPPPRSGHEGAQPHIPVPPRPTEPEQPKPPQTSPPPGSESPDPPESPEPPESPGPPTGPGDPDPGDPDPGDPDPGDPDPGDPDPGDPDPPTTPEEPPVLQLGDEGPEVVELQMRLLQLGWVYNGATDGVFDEETRAAVARFQTAYGITDDPEGVYGAASRAVLEANTTV